MGVRPAKTEMEKVIGETSLMSKSHLGAEITKRSKYRSGWKKGGTILKHVTNNMTNGKLITDGGNGNYKT